MSPSSPRSLRQCIPHQLLHGVFAKQGFFFIIHREPIFRTQPTHTFFKDILTKLVPRMSRFRVNFYDVYQKYEVLRWHGLSYVLLTINHTQPALLVHPPTKRQQCFISIQTRVHLICGTVGWHYTCCISQLLRVSIMHAANITCLSTHFYWVSPMFDRYERYYTPTMY